VKNREAVTVKAQKIDFSQGGKQQVYVGRVEAGKTSVISSSYPGKLLKICVREGQKLRAGDTLAIIDSPMVASLYENAKATYEQARDALDRVNQVYATGSVTELKLVEVQTQYSKASSAYIAAKRAKSDCSIKAPFSGLVSDIIVQEGVELVASEPMFKFLDLSYLEVHASIPENEYSTYSVGQEAHIFVNAVDTIYTVKLQNKGFEASPLSHSYDFVYRISGNYGNLMPGMVCKVYMYSSAETDTTFCNTVIIPSSSVRYDLDGKYVWCIGQDGAAVKRYVQISGFSGDGVIVEEGLMEGDYLVIEGGRKISSGMKNIIVDESR